MIVSRFKNVTRVGLFAVVLGLAPLTGVAQAAVGGGAGGGGAGTTAQQTQDDGSDWGWLGLLGLIGLAGLAGLKRRDDHVHTGRTTTTPGSHV